MKAVAKIVVRPKALTPSRYQLLCEKFPEGNRPNLFRIELPLDCSGVEEITSFLENEGLQRYHTSTVGYYGYQVHRSYEDSDFEAARLLKLSPVEWVHVGNEGRNAKGQAIIDPVELEKDARCPFQAGFTEEAYFVLDSIKTVLEKGNLEGLSFRETEWSDPIRFFKRERIWDMYSDVVLPKMSNVANLVHANSEPFSGDYSRPINIREEPFARGGGEIHYRRSELDAVGHFDLARTYEFHLSRRYSLIASQRFFRFCHEHRLPFEWQPVRIDPD